MKLRTLSLDDEPQMLELLRSEKQSKDTEYYLDRGASFWAPYRWFSKKDNIAMGVFAADQLVGMTVVVKLPFSFRGNEADVYVATDMLVHPNFRRSFAAAKLFTGLHTILPKNRFFELCIENKPGFARALPRISSRFGYETGSPGETTLTTFYPNQKQLAIPKNSNFEISEDWNKIDAHLREYQSFSNSWTEWQETIELKCVFEKVQLFSYSEGSYQLTGLLIDRGNLQKVRWNGQPRLLIEKYRRYLKSKQVELAIDSELPFLTTGFLVNPSNKISRGVVSALANCGLENRYFGINFRDSNIEIPQEIDHASFPRKIYISTNFSKVDLDRLFLANHARPLFLESIYL